MTKMENLYNNFVPVQVLEMLFPSLKEGKFFRGVVPPPDSPTASGSNQTCLPTPRFAGILLNMQYHFPSH